MAKFKYNINNHINQLPRDITIEDLVKIFEKSGISRDTFYRDRNILSGSEQSIPSDRLFTYADLFGCDIAELVNDPRKKVKSIREQLLKARPKLKTGLS